MFNVYHVHNYTFKYTYVDYCNEMFLNTICLLQGMYITYVLNIAYIYDLINVCC